ncbi:MAG: MBL fold metallo-hydrolase [Planctomycetota bacterium]|jgi:beta-lactamase superfamily II metal-dependent hydrolase
MLTPATLTRSLTLSAFCASLAFAQNLEVHFIDVGQGHCSFILGPNGTRVLVDAGEFGNGTTITDYLTSIGVTDLDYSILTHYHADHCGSMDEVYNNGWRPNVAAWDRGDENFYSTNQSNQYVDNAGSLRYTPIVGDTIDLGDGAFLEVLCLNGDYAGGSVDVLGSVQEENARSLGIVLRYKDFDLYTAGDLTSGGNSTKNVEGLVAPLVGQVEVAQVSHSGSNTSSSQTVVDALDPSFVAISVGLDNPFSHPTETTVKRWNPTDASRVVWTTSEGDTDNGSGGFTSGEGSFFVSTDGTTFSVEAVASGERVAFTTFENPGTAADSSNLRVSELLVNPGASDDSVGEWFELTNVTGQPIDLGGVDVQVGSNSFTFNSRLLIEPGDFLTFGVDGKPSRNGGYHADHVAPWESFSLPNGTTNMTVRAANNATVESLTWGSSNIPVISGVSQERDDLNGSTQAGNWSDATAAWSGSAGDFGTPGDGEGDVTPTGPATLSTNPPAINSPLLFSLSSPEEPFATYILGLSEGVAPGFEAFGLQVNLNPTATFFESIAWPNFIGALDGNGERQILIFIPNDPTLQGQLLFSSFITLGPGPFGLEGLSVSNTVILLVS